MEPRFYIVDVFSERPLGGNPLAVVVADQWLPDTVMQQIAAEMNFSETTFVASTPGDREAYPVRIFTPAREIAFAGHPILGTAWVLRHQVCVGAPDPVRLALAVGELPVTFGTEDGREVAWFQAPPITLGATCAPERIAPALGLAPGDIATDTPVQVASASTAAVIVPLRSLDGLRRARLNLDAFGALAQEGYPPLVYLFCRETHDPRNDVCVRFFFEAHGVREDPATGNGAAFFGAYLLEHGAAEETRLDLRIEQGHELLRPSLIRLRAARTGDGARNVSVGGQVALTVRGQLMASGQ